MSRHASKQIVLDAWAAFASRDRRRIAAAFTEDAEWLAPPGNATAVALGFTDHMIGREQIAEFIAVEFGKLFVSDVRLDFKGVYAEDHVVVVEERMSATLASGRPYELDYCFIFELRQGRIARVREYMDTAAGHRMMFGQTDAQAAQPNA